VVFELPPSTEDTLCVGDEIPILYDPEDPVRILPPWRNAFVAHFWRAISGIVIFGLLWIGVAIYHPRAAGNGR
jgi:hypothetical protein